MSATDRMAAKHRELLATVRSYESCAVAFSAGIDSTVVAKAAQLMLGDRAVAVTGVSPSLASGELPQAQELAQIIGIRHEVLRTSEIHNADYVRNAPDRCYHCKTELYSQMGPVALRLGLAVIANGVNADDLGDYRPGLQAAGEHAVRSPLADCGFTKQDVRDLAEFWQLPTWNKPASPCLSSRIAYGEAVTPQRLGMIDQAESYLKSLGLVHLRVRLHAGDMARIEVPGQELARFCTPEIRRGVLSTMKSLGFKYVTLDLEGLRSGSQNEVLPVEVLTRTRPG